MKLKDGRQQSVVYTSDEYGGYKATVEYSDENTRVDQARNEDNTHGSYQVKTIIIYYSFVTTVAGDPGWW